MATDQTRVAQQNGGNRRAEQSMHEKEAATLDIGRRLMAVRLWAKYGAAVNLGTKEAAARTLVKSKGKPMRAIEGRRGEMRSCIIALAMASEDGPTATGRSVTT